MGDIADANIEEGFDQLARHEAGDCGPDMCQYCETEAPICPYCRKLSKQVTGREVYPHRRDLWDKQFYVCTPCDARVGCHANGEPLGRLANAELRRWKINAHTVFDHAWKNKHMNRNKAYKWLAECLGIPTNECHIGMFDVDQCKRVVKACRDLPPM